MSRVTTRTFPRQELASLATMKMTVSYVTLEWVMVLEEGLMILTLMGTRLNTRASTMKRDTSRPWDLSLYSDKAMIHLDAMSIYGISSQRTITVYIMTFFLKNIYTSGDCRLAIQGRTFGRAYHQKIDFIGDLI